MIDVQKYIQMGFTPEEVNAAVGELQQQQSQLQQSYARSQHMNPIQRSDTIVAGIGNQENLIKWQLELDSILERIEHMLRGDKPRYVDGNLIFVPPLTESERMFNDEGVAEIMRILSIYLNRNTILSNYDEETINWKILDFGYEVSDIIFLKYEEMGLDSLHKRKRYSMVVHELIDAVHSAYLRALNGGERDSLRQARNITQSENLMHGQTMMPQMKERSVLNPMRFFKGKYL